MGVHELEEAGLVEYAGLGVVFVVLSELGQFLSTLLRLVVLLKVLEIVIVSLVGQDVLKFALSL